MGYSTSFSGEFRFSRKPLESVLQQIRDLDGVDTRDLEDQVEQEYPGYYCQWVLTSDEQGLKWDQNEKFYDYVEWLEWIIDKILRPAGIKLTGTVNYSGDDAKDCGTIEIGEDQSVVKTETALVGNKVKELREFRDFVLASDWGDEILEAWKNR